MSDRIPYRTPPGIHPESDLCLCLCLCLASRCPQHVGDPDPPNCGKCADARKTHERWEAERPTPNRLSGSPDFDAIEHAAAHGTRRGQLAAQARAAIRGGQLTEEGT